MANNQPHSSTDQPTLLDRLGQMPAAAEGLFTYSVKIVCG